MQLRGFRLRAARILVVSSLSYLVCDPVGRFVTVFSRAVCIIVLDANEKYDIIQYVNRYPSSRPEKRATRRDEVWMCAIHRSSLWM
jgi:hypothetical protein